VHGAVQKGECSACAWRVVCVPGVGDDDVVEGRMTLAEARETDLENHGMYGLWYIVLGRKGECFVKGLSFAETHLVPPLQKMAGFRDEQTNAKNSHPGINFCFTFLSLSPHCLLIHFSQSHDRSLSQLTLSVLIVDSILHHVTLRIYKYY
jgi:hypothetical protein